MHELLPVRLHTSWFHLWHTVPDSQSGYDTDGHYVYAPDPQSEAAQELGRTVAPFLSLFRWYKGSYELLGIEQDIPCDLISAVSPFTYMYI